LKSASGGPAGGRTFEKFDKQVLTVDFVATNGAFEEQGPQLKPLWRTVHHAEHGANADASTLK